MPRGSGLSKLLRRWKACSTSSRSLISIVLIFLVLLHSGKDAGSRAPSASAPPAARGVGGSLVERNLDRWTIFFAILFVVNTLVLLKI